MIEDILDHKIQSKWKTFAPVAFRSKKLFPRTTQDVNLLKRILAIYVAFHEFAHILWEASKPTIVLTDNKWVTQIFQIKAIPPSLWNACNFVLQFSFDIAHIAGSDNTTAEFLSRLELKVTGKIPLKIREDVETKPIEVTRPSSDVADEEQFFFTRADGEDETDEQIRHQKDQSRKKT